MADALRSLARYVAASSVMELRISATDPDAEAHLTFKDVMYLNLIAVNEGCTATRLAELACVSKPTITVRLNALEAKGIIRRARSEEDGRVQILEVVGPIAKAYGHEWDFLARVSDSLVERFGEERVEQFAEMLDEVSRQMNEYEPPIDDGNDASHDDVAGPGGRRRPEQVRLGGPRGPCPLHPADRERRDIRLQGRRQADILHQDGGLEPLRPGRRGRGRLPRGPRRARGRHGRDQEEDERVPRHRPRRGREVRRMRLRGGLRSGLQVVRPCHLFRRIRRGPDALRPPRGDRRHRPGEHPHGGGPLQDRGRRRASPTRRPSAEPS